MGCASACFPIVVDFDPLSARRPKFEPVPLEVGVAAVGLGRTPTPQDRIDPQRAAVEQESARDRRLAPARGRYEIFTRWHDRSTDEFSHDANLRANERIADFHHSGPNDVAINAHHGVPMRSDESQDFGVGAAAARIVGRRHAAFDRMAHAQKRPTEFEFGALEGGFIALELCDGANEEVGPEPLGLDRISGQTADLVQPAVDEQRDRCSVEKWSVATVREGHAAVCAKGDGLLGTDGEMQAIVLLPAIGLALASVTALDEKRAGAIARDARRRNRRVLERLPAQALDRIAPDRGQRSYDHGVVLPGVFRVPCQKRRAMELRPLGFGEIFDRAITLYVRNFWPFFAIVLVLIVPLAIVQYVLDSSQSAQFYEVLRVLQHPNERPPTLPNLFGSPGQIVTVVITALIFYVLWPFALNAVAIGVARLYRGRAVEFAACYEAVIPRWASILGTLIIQFAVFIAWYLAFLAVLFTSIIVATVFARAWLPLGIAGFFIAAIATIAVLFLLAPIFIALTFAMNSVVIEMRGPFAAIGSGFSRVFNRREFWRAVLFSLAAFAVIFGSSIVISGITLAALFVHAVAVEVVLGSLLRAAFAPFSIVLIAVYYFDVRIRREGFDLEAELERITPAPAIAPA
jgi:hypothetical protein